MLDGDFESQIVRRVLGDLDDLYGNADSAKLNGNTPICSGEYNPRRSIDRDCHVPVGLAPEARESNEHNGTNLPWEVGSQGSWQSEIREHRWNRLGSQECNVH